MDIIFKDHFSGHAEAYATFRPHYPEPFYAWLINLTARQENAWDCGTGNGQAAIRLAESFDTVTATDASAQQIRQAQPHPKVHYFVEPAEQSHLETGSVDIITAAASIHWFDMHAFYGEVKRVARRDALLAVWAYDRVKISNEIDILVDRLYYDIAGPFWPKERRWVEEQYKTIPFPFEEISAPSFAINHTLTVDDLIGYLRTWSSVQGYLKVHGKDPVDLITGELHNLWGSEKRPVEWPMFMRIGRIHK